MENHNKINTLLEAGDKIHGSVYKAMKSGLLTHTEYLRLSGFRNRFRKIGTQIGISVEVFELAARYAGKQITITVK